MEGMSSRGCFELTDYANFVARVDELLDVDFEAVCWVYLSASRPE